METNGHKRNYFKSIVNLFVSRLHRIGFQIQFLNKLVMDAIRHPNSILVTRLGML